MHPQSHILIRATDGATINIHPQSVGELLEAEFVSTLESKPALEWKDDICDDTVDFDDAQKAIAKLGHGWRMPTRQELESCLDLTRHDPAIDPQQHPHIKSEYYWSSTPCAWSSDLVWVVSFYGGYVNDFHRYGFARVRAVRSVASQ